MKRIALTVAFGLVLGAMTTPCAAQTRLDSVTADRANEREARVATATNRITAIFAETLGAPGIAVATSPNGLADAIEARAAVVADARAELSAMRQRVSALPPLARAGGPEILNGVDTGTLKLVEMAAKADDVLAAMQAIPDAVRTGDQGHFDAAYRRMISGLVVLHEIQALTLRQQTRHQEEGDPQKSQFLAMACMADGQAGMQAGMSGLIARDVASRQMVEAETCMRTQIVQGRADLEAVKDANAMRIRLSPLDVVLFDVIEDSADWLHEVAGAMARNENSGVIAGTYNPTLMRITARIQDITGEQRRIIADGA